MQRCWSLAAALVLVLALLVPMVPWAFQRFFWYMNSTPAGQAIHVPKFLPNIYDNLVRGIPANSFITDRRMDFLEQNFTHVPGDVWVITYQKVGTTWTQYIVTLVLGHPQIGSLFDIHTLCPWPEVGISIMSTPTSVLEQSATTAKVPRCFKSHWPRTGFFASLPETSKVIYVYRDAESVAVSYWNHIFNLFGLYFLKEGDMTWDQYFEKWISGDMQMGGYFEHVASWWEVRNKANTLFLRYEELRADTAGSIRRIADFIAPATPLSDERLTQILELTSKKSMHACNQAWLDSFLIKMGVMKGDHIRKDDAKGRMQCSDTQRVRMLERYQAVLGHLDVPLEHLFVQKEPIAAATV